MPAALERTFTKSGLTTTTTDPTTASWLLSEGWTESGSGTRVEPTIVAATRPAELARVADIQQERVPNWDLRDWAGSVDTPQYWSGFWQSGKLELVKDVDVFRTSGASWRTRVDTGGLQRMGTSAFTVEGNTQYTVRALVRTEDASICKASLLFMSTNGATDADFFAVGMTQQGDTLIPVGESDAWVEVSQTFTVPAGHRRARVYVNLGTTGGPLTNWLDSVSVRGVQQPGLQRSFNRDTQVAFWQVRGPSNVRITGGATANAPFGVQWSQMSFVGAPSARWSSRYIDVYQPAVGTVINGSAGAPDRAVTSQGVQLAPWDTLWYEPPAAGGSTDNSRFHVTNYTSDFEIPDTWLFICSRDNWGAGLGANGYYDEVRFANGHRQTPWINPGYFNAWTDYGTTWGGLRVCKINGEVRFRGLVKSPGVDYMGTATITVMPAGWRPAGGMDLLFAVPAAGPGMMRVDMYAAGDLQTNGPASGAPATSGWVSLAGIRYAAEN